MRWWVSAMRVCIRQCTVSMYFSVSFHFLCVIFVYIYIFYSMVFLSFSRWLYFVRGATFFFSPFVFWSVICFFHDALAIQYTHTYTYVHTHSLQTIFNVVILSVVFLSYGILSFQDRVYLFAIIESSKREKNTYNDK